jgi:RES domain
VTRGRQQPSLKPPPPTLTRFPRRRLDEQTALFRVVQQGNGPWWFSCSGQGRFDLSPPQGTCYLTRDPLAALLEIIGPTLVDGVVSDRFIQQRRIHKLRPPRSQQLADLTSRKSVGHGVTAEIFTITPYTLPQAWASALREAGFDGLDYSVRHDPSPTADGVALFGAVGERKRWRRGRAEQLDKALIERLSRECSICVAAVPTAQELTFAKLPEEG